MGKNNKIKIYILIFAIIITFTALIVSSYAWFSSTLDVEIRDFRVFSDTKNGLFISLDGVNWTESVDITKENIITNLKAIYPNHTNQWSNGMKSVSTIGLKRMTDAKFTIFGNKKDLFTRIAYDNTDTIITHQLSEDFPNDDAEFVAFDIFLKNVTGSPISDNLYISKDSFIGDSVNNVHDDTALNSVRLGLVIYDSVSNQSNITTIQNTSCKNNCIQHIYEPYSENHNERSIRILKAHNVEIEDGVRYPTYALINSGDSVNMWAGIIDSGIDFDENYFDYQDTITNFNDSICKLPDGIIKIRVYIWIEAQDIDIIEESSDGYYISVMLTFEKDLAGYE